MTTDAGMLGLRQDNHRNPTEAHMPNVIAFLLVVAFISGVVAWVRRRRARPERRLMRDFARLQRLILSGLDKRHRKEANGLLGACEAYLESLLLAKEQQRLLASMSGAAGELTGRPIADRGRAAIEAFDNQVAEDLANFFASLSRISTVVGLQKDEALGSLRGFTEDLELQRAALVQLTLELQQHKSPVTLPEVVEVGRE